MTGEYRVRPACADDAEEFVRAHEAAWNATAGAIVGKSLEELMPFETRVARYRASISDAPENARAWVAERAGMILGIAVGRRDRDAVELRDLYVVPSAWGTGVAKMLMGAALDSVKGDAGVSFPLGWTGQRSSPPVLRARRVVRRRNQW